MLSLVSVLIVAVPTCLWSMFKQCSESPLLTHLETIVSWLLGSSRLSTVLSSRLLVQILQFLPVSHGALAPFRLCSHSQPQSSPWDLTSKAWTSAPSPHPTQWVSRQASKAGGCWSTLISCVGISPLCPLHPCCCTLFHGSKDSPQHTPRIHQWRGFLVCGNFSSFTAPSQRCRSHPYSFVSFLFCFALPRYMGSFLPFGRSEVFCQCSVGVL